MTPDISLCPGLVIVLSKAGVPRKQNQIHGALNILNMVAWPICRVKCLSQDPTRRVSFHRSQIHNSFFLRWAGTSDLRYRFRYHDHFPRSNICCITLSFRKLLAESSSCVPISYYHCGYCCFLNLRNSMCFIVTVLVTAKYSRDPDIGQCPNATVVF